MHQKLTGILLLAVAASVALNLYLLVNRSGKAAPKPKAVKQAAKPKRPDCCQGLAQCQRQRYVAALQAFGGSGAKRPRKKPTARPAPATQPAATTDVGLKEQQAALCAVATEGLRKAWVAAGDGLAKSLRKSLANEANQERDLNREVERFGDALELTPADRDRLETHYRPLRQKRIAEALASLEKAPPDWKAVHQAAQSLWQDQDRLTKELFGSDAVPKLRRAELKPRTTILALIAAQAGLDWDQSIAW